MALVVAVGCPLAFSSDVYSYVADGLLQVRHGLSPYSHSPSELAALGEAHAELMYRDFPTVYGPVWLLVCFAVSGLFGASLWLAAMVFKLLAAAALVAAALLGRALAERDHPGSGARVFLAIGLNPLFLLEGPGNGHNDLAMMALFLAGAWLVLQQRPAWG